MMKKGRPYCNYLSPETSDSTREQVFFLSSQISDQSELSAWLVLLLVAVCVSHLSWPESQFEDEEEDRFFLGFLLFWLLFPSFASGCEGHDGGTVEQVGQVKMSIDRNAYIRLETRTGDGIFFKGEFGVLKVRKGSFCGMRAVFEGIRRYTEYTFWFTSKK